MADSDSCSCRSFLFQPPVAAVVLVANNHSKSITDFTKALQSQDMTCFDTNLGQNQLCTKVLQNIEFEAWFSYSEFLCTGQGKVREKRFSFKVREKSGNFYLS